MVLESPSTEQVSTDIRRPCYPIEFGSGKWVAGSVNPLGPPVFLQICCDANPDTPIAKTFCFISDLVLSVLLGVEVSCSIDFHSTKINAFPLRRLSHYVQFFGDRSKKPDSLIQGQRKNYVQFQLQLKTRMMRDPEIAYLLGDRDVIRRRALASESREEKERTQNLEVFEQREREGEREREEETEVEWGELCELGDGLRERESY
ncbi:hypothetical protein B296_00036539 [Ensete ventricosum]|uniref:Uncharacterized protein n=1 Tax=Ensete ventricosum TaxID=4639 RepID=A0A426XZU6_ENSVE|nr:hypothetical protein B296_00036539 [Ensete ventricosum]